MRRFLASWWLRILLLILPFVPYVWWHLTPSQPLKLLLVDKTVPKADYREHQGLAWLLRHHKYTDPAGRLFDPAVDYYGFRPSLGRGDESIDPAPDLDLIYVADTYGVYDADLGQNLQGERSRLLYGGLRRQEWDALWNAKGPRTTLIMEFNAIASPTEPVVRAAVERDLGITWSGWIGRYFADLGGTEVPGWAVRNWEQQHGARWAYEGKGVLFVDESDRVLVLTSAEVTSLVRFVPTAEGLEHYPGLKPVPYPYWFDVVTATAGQVEEAYYELEMTDAARAKLKQAGIPARFPAILRSQDRTVYYFAGDYADKAGSPPFRFRGAQRALSLLVARSEDLFYWRVYLPVMERILQDVRETGGAPGSSDGQR